MARVRAALVLALATLSAACRGGVCDEWSRLCLDTDGGGGSGANSDGGNGAGPTGGGGSGGGGGGPGCDPSEGHPILADCGVFVAAGSNGDGSQRSPYGSLTEAVENLDGADAIYVCGDDVLDDSIILPPGVSILGRLDCAGWTYSISNPRATIQGDPNTPALSITGAGQATLRGLRIRAADAVIDGRSSVAVFLSEAEVDIIDSELIAGDGADGINGFAQAKTNTPAAARGESPGMGCSGAATMPGGDGGTNVCNGDPTNGGDGGDGTSANSGLTGNAGNPLGATNTGGKGETLTNPTACGVGGPGGPGGPGDPGDGAGEDDLGEITATGFTPASGSPGDTPGFPGQGGGGGGGANVCTGAGPAGGGGGAGGCGGNPGQPGGGGGGSFALLVYESDVMLRDVTLRSSDGGDGGDGDGGQEGMDGGFPGAGEAPACSGGMGGKGGRGGAGGGGRGGPSIGIAYAGPAPEEEGVIEIFTASSVAPAGSGGNGGAGNIGGTGAEGFIAERQAF